MEPGQSAGYIFPMEDDSMPVKKEERKTAIGESSEDEPLYKMSKLSLGEETVKSKSATAGLPKQVFLSAGFTPREVEMPTFPEEKTKAISDSHVFLVCPDCLIKMSLKDGAYHMSLKTEEGMSYSLKIPFKCFTKDDTTEVNLKQILLIAKAVIGEKRRLTTGPSTQAEAILESKRYYTSSQLKKIVLDVLYYYPNFSEKKLQHRIPFYLNSLQIENMELILNNLTWEIIPTKLFVKLLMIGLCKLVIMDLAFLQLSDFPAILYRDEFESILERNVYELCRYVSIIHTHFSPFTEEMLTRLYLQMKLCVFLSAGHKKDEIVGDLFRVQQNKLIANASPNLVNSFSEIYMAVDRIRARKLLPIFKKFNAYHYLIILKDFFPDYSVDILFSESEGASSSS